MKKRMFAFALCAVMVLSLAACGGNDNAQTTPTPASNAETLTGSAEGFGGEVAVTLTRENGVITACSLVGDSETETVGQAALPDLEAQVVAANGYDIDGVSGATITSRAVKTAVAAALGETYSEETAAPAPVETAAPAEVVKIEGGLQIGLAYGAAHGTKCFSEAYAVVQDDVIIAAFLDEFQFVAAGTEGITPVPNSDSDFGAGYAEGQVLCSKRTIADYYSSIMAKNAGSTVRIDDNFDAIQTFVVGKTIAEVEAAAGQDNAVDAVSGATLADTANYLKLIAQAAKNAQANQGVEFNGNSDDLKLSVVYGAAHGTQCFSVAAALTEGDKIVLSYLDEFQFVAADTEGITPVPNSDSDFAAGYAEGQVLCSKRTIADYYSSIMTNYAGATVRIDENYNAIQNAVNGMTIAEAKALAGQDNAADAVSGATLADTANYVALIATAAEK